MAVKLTLEFKSVDEAIVALGKLVGVKVSAAPQTPGATGAEKAPENSGSAHPQAVAAETRTRRPRADKGQRREPYGPRTTTGEPVASESGVSGSVSARNPQPAVPVASTKTATPQKAPAEGDKPLPSGVVPAASVATPTLAEVQESLNKLYEAKGHDVSLAVLNRFGVNKAKNLLPDAWADFIGLARHVLDGGQP